MEGDKHPDDILALFQGARDATSVVVVVEGVPLARQAVVGASVEIASVFGNTAVRAADRAGRPPVLPGGLHINPGRVVHVDDKIGAVVRRGFSCELKEYVFTFRGKRHY